jgi:nitroreductase
MSVMLSAWDRGVATCPMGGFDAEGVLNEFDIPAQFEPVMLLTMGYPVEESDDLQNERKLRRETDEVLHFGSFEGLKTADPTPADD